MEKSEKDNKKRSQNNNKNPNYKKKVFVFSIKLSLVAFALLSTVCMYYYSVVLNSSLEAEEKWSLPAIVYSRPLELSVDQKITYTQLLYELNLLKYRKVYDPKNPGEYSESKNKTKLVIIRRAFDFPSGREEARPLLLSFTNNKIARIQDADTLNDIDYVMLEPVLLDRLGDEEQEDRVLIKYDDLPQKFVDTLLYVEDRDFYSHYGVNPLAILRAVYVNLKAGKRKQGGSTITQQLVKNYFLTREKTLDRKVREIFMSLIVDARYEKNEIIEMYCNEIYLGRGKRDIYGFGLASRYYFGLPINELDWHQVAMLVAMIKGPSYYNPHRHPERVKERRDLVLKLMNQAGKISDKELALYTNKPLGVVNNSDIQKMSVPSYISLLKSELVKLLGNDYIKNYKNLVIHTSLDPQVQIAANKAVESVMSSFNKNRKKKLESAVVVSNWRTSDVLAVVGSSDPSYPGLNRVTNAKRQIGSLVKPAAYLTAFANGWHLGSMVHDSQVTVKQKNGQLWTPKNFDKKFLGWMPLYEAFATSRNVPMVRVGMNVKVKNVIDTLNLLGYRGTLQEVPSLLLGSMSMTPYEVNQMYSTIAREGLFDKLSVVRAISDKNTVIYDRANELRAEQVVDPRDAYLTIYGMTVVTSSGTAKLLNKYNKTLAGKTGTSNSNRDSWFSGFDNDELVTVWVGYDDNSPTGLTGSSGALRVYDKFASIRGVKELKIAKPEGVEFVNFSMEGSNSYIMDAETCTDVDEYVELPVRTDMVRTEQMKKCGNFFKRAYDAAEGFIQGLFY